MFEEAGHLLHHSSSGSSVPSVPATEQLFIHEHEEEETGWEEGFCAIINDQSSDF